MSQTLDEAMEQAKERLIQLLTLPSSLADSHNHDHRLVIPDQEIQASPTSAAPTTSTRGTTMLDRDQLEIEFSYLHHQQLVNWNHQWPNHHADLLMSRHDVDSRITGVPIFIDGKETRSYLVRCMNHNTGEVDYMSFSSVGEHWSCHCDGDKACSSCRGSGYVSVIHEAHWYPGMVGFNDHERISHVQLATWVADVYGDAIPRIIQRLERGHDVEPDQDGIE